MTSQIRLLHPARDTIADPFGSTEFQDQQIGHFPIEEIETNGLTMARGLAIAGLASAGVVAVSARLASPQEHTVVTMPAPGDASQQRRPRHRSRRCLLGVSRLEQSLNEVELLLTDDGWHTDRDPFRDRLVLICAGVRPVEEVLPGIRLARQNPMDDSEGELASAQANAIGIEVVDDRLHSIGRPLIVAMEVEIVHLSDDGGFIRFDLQDLLRLVSLLAHLDCPIAKGWDGPIPVSKGCVPFH
nr:hypothetical protein [Hypericibacter adhaerens]